jgi:hypothetical protein
MKNILKISPSILFGLTIILMIIPSFDDGIERDKVGLGIWATLILSLVLLSWYYSIGVVLQKRYTVKGAQLFKFNALFLLIFMPILCLGIVEKEIIQDYIKIILFLCLYLFFAFFQILVYCSKLLAMDSQKQVPEFPAYFQYILLLWLFPIGIWFIQPKMNKLLS